MDKKILIKSIFEFPQIDPVINYSNIVRITLIGVFLAKLFPFSLLLCSLNLFLFY